MTHRFTCAPEADADLAGTPARIRFVASNGVTVLNFDDGSALAVPFSQVRALRVIEENA